MIFITNVARINFALISKTLRTHFAPISHKTQFNKKQTVNWIRFYLCTLCRINCELKQIKNHHRRYKHHLISNSPQTILTQSSILQRIHFDETDSNSSHTNFEKLIVKKDKRTKKQQITRTSSQPTANEVTTHKPTSKRLRSYLRSPVLTPPRANNELTKHCRLTDLERTANQLTPASIYPWTSYELSSIAERTKFKLSSDHLQTKFDLTTTRLRA